VGSNSRIIVQSAMRIRPIFKLLVRFLRQIACVFRKVALTNLGRFVVGFRKSKTEAAPIKNDPSYKIIPF